MDTYHFEPFDGPADGGSPPAGDPEEGWNCPICGGKLAWVDCVSCIGDGCLACDDEGGWYHCRPCREAFTLKRLEWEHERQLNQREE